MTDPVHPALLRASDADRAATQDRLRRAVADGQLDLSEFDQRCAQAWSSRTRGDLAAVVRDLPEPLPPPPVPPRFRVFTDTGGGTTMRVLATIWACALVVNVIVWFLASVAGGDFLYLWPVWLVPPGAVLGVLYASGIGRPQLTGRTGQPR